MHDTVWRVTTWNDTKTRIYLINKGIFLLKRGKYFVAPPGDGSDFKDLFRRMARQGAGRPVGNDGVPDGPWTAELLTSAISQIENNRSAIDLRTVQRWFQDNDQGIRAENIRWLAWVFGCGDPDASIKWQAELSAAQSRLAAKRRAMRKSYKADGLEDSAIGQNPNIGGDSPPRRKRVSLAMRVEGMFDGHGSLNLPIVVWSCLSVLWFLAYIAGVHSITYSPIMGLHKQVGFFWSPAWNVGEMVFLPIFFIIVAETLNFWKHDGRSLIAGMRDDEAWTRKVESFSSSYWSILFICFVVIFLVQWSGVYLFTLMDFNHHISMVDWILVATVRPEDVSLTEAIPLSLLAFLYSGMIYWFFFNGLLLLFTVASNFAERCRSQDLQSLGDHQNHVREVGIKIMRGVFRGTILGCLIAICIKLNAAYLISDAETFSSWLVNDALFALRLRNQEWGWLDQNPSPFFTSLLLLFIVCFVFFVSLSQIVLALERSLQDEILKNQARAIWLQMSGVVVLLGASFFLIGAFTGFSILLVTSLLIAASSFFWSMRLSDGK